MSVATQTALYDTVRAHLLAWPGVGAIVGSGGSARGYHDAPPDFAAWPGTMFVLEIVGPDTTAGGHQDFGRVRIVVTVYARPRSKRQEARRLGDLVMAALKHFTVVTDGFLHVEALRRQPFGFEGLDEADREVVAQRLEADAEIAPDYLTSVPT